MDPRELLASSSPLGNPAPFWFLELFKVLGFTLHMVPMNLWYAGIVLAVLFRWRGGEHARTFSARLMRQMPIIIAMGVNLGIVPLLFTQVAYYKVFYPATILMAWPWLMIVPMLAVAYYGVYFYVSGLKEGAEMKRLKLMAGWASAGLFLVIGFVFANGFSLMTALDRWPELWKGSSTAGAALGTALNVGDGSLWPRWLMMFGLAMTTLAVYVVVDAAFFARRESEEYRRWARAFAIKLSTAGVVWFAATGSWYVFIAMPDAIRSDILGGPWLALTIITAISIGLPWLLIAMQAGGVTRSLAVLTGLAQFSVLGLNAFSRQLVQNAQLKPFWDVAAERVNSQWSPLFVFLLLFVVGLVVVLWMVRQVIQAHGTPATETAGPEQARAGR